METVLVAKKDLASSPVHETMGLHNDYGRAMRYALLGQTESRTSLTPTILATGSFAPRGVKS
jgi:hypothetical protein